MFDKVYSSMIRKHLLMSKEKKYQNFIYYMGYKSLDACFCKDKVRNLILIWK